MTCRRGDIRGSDVGAIRIETGFSLIDVARNVADSFERAVAAPDPRNPKVRITRAEPTQEPPREARTEAPPMRPQRPPYRPKKRT